MINPHNDVDHGNMVRDTADVWPDQTVVGKFDITPHGVEGYPGCTAHISFICPMRRHCAVLLGPVNVPRPSPDKLNVWGWDGNLDHPTITPSINCRSVKDDGMPAGGCGWHGFITNGVIR